MFAILGDLWWYLPGLGQGQGPGEKQKGGFGEGEPHSTG
jgi:hypothetical protein